MGVEYELNCNTCKVYVELLKCRPIRNMPYNWEAIPLFIEEARSRWAFYYLQFKWVSRGYEYLGDLVEQFQIQHQNHEIELQNDHGSLTRWRADEKGLWLNFSSNPNQYISPTNARTLLEIAHVTTWYQACLYRGHRGKGDNLKQPNRKTFHLLQRKPLGMDTKTQTVQSLFSICLREVCFNAEMYPPSQLDRIPLDIVQVLLLIVFIKLTLFCRR